MIKGGEIYQGDNMIELHGTLFEKLEQAIDMVCTEVTNEEIERFYVIYKNAGIKPSLAAVNFFKKLGGAYKDNYIMLPDPKHNAEIEYVHFLSKGGADVADSIPSVNGKRIEIINGKAVTMFEVARGEQIAEHGYRYIDGVPIDEYFYLTGKVLGKIHALSKQYKPVYKRFDFFEKYNEDYFESLIPDDFDVEAPFEVEI